MTIKITKDVDPADLEKLLLRVSDQLEKAEDIFSPGAQREFRSYKGTLNQYMRERDLRIKAGGRKRTFFNIAAALTGNENISRIISEKFDEKFSNAEVEEAKQALRDEFGIKEEKKDEPKTEELFDRYFKPITESINGIVKAVDKTTEDIKSVHSSLMTIANSMVPVINDMATALAGRGESSSAITEKLKPLTVPDEEGREYLYYPDAPEGRRLYEKSKTGTAGRIASKKVQRKLKGKINAMMKDKSAAPIRKFDGTETQEDRIITSILDGVQRLINEESAYRKTEMQELMTELKKTLGVTNPDSIFNQEEDEKNAKLKKAVKEALKEFADENPELFESNGGSGLGGLLAGLLGAKGLKGLAARFLPAAAASAEAGAAGAGAATAAETAIATGAGGGILGTIGAFAAPLLGAVGATGAIFGGIDTGMKSVAEKAIQQVAAGSVSDIATALTNGTNQEYKRQRLHQLAENDPALKLKLQKAEEMAGLVNPQLKPEPGSAVVVERKSEPMGQQIIDQNRKKLEINSAEEVTIPSQTVNNFNSTSVIPVPSTDKSISVNNPDNTFNRLLAQEFNHPSTYSSLTMG